MNPTLAKNVHGTTALRAKVRASARLTLIATLALLAVPASAAAQTMPTQAERTAHYSLDLTVGPAETMISPMDAMKAQTGEIMVNGGSMMDSGHSMSPGTAMSPMPDMMTTGGGMGQPSASTASVAMGMATPGVDQGMPVNHHVEVHITQNDTGAVVNNVTPTFRITDKLTGQSRDLPQVMAMYGVQAGASDFHYGQNVYLPDGAYEVTVMIGSDTASFRDVMVTGGAPMMSNMPIGSGAMTHSSSMSGMGSDAVARDGGRLANQSPAVQSLFTSIWKDRAAQEWASEHNASLTMP